MMKHRAFGEAPSFVVAAGTVTINSDGVIVLAGVPQTNSAKAKFFTAVAVQGPVQADFTLAWAISGAGTFTVAGVSVGFEQHGVKAMTFTAGLWVVYFFN